MPATPRPDRRSRRPLILAALAGLIIVAWIGCHNSSRDAGALTSAGVTHLQMRQYERAIRDFDRALALQPGLVVAWRQRGIAYRGKGDYERALADFDQAILLAPSDARLYTERGLTFELLGDYTRAIREFDRAISFKPNNAPAIENRGRTHFYLGNFAQSAADLQRGLSLDSTNAEVALWLHLARQRLGQDDASDFEAHAAPIDSVQWPAPVVRYFLGTLSADSLRAAAAVDSTGRERRCSVAFYLGQEALLGGRTETATKLFETARTECPKELSVHRAALAELRRLAVQAGPERAAATASAADGT